MNFLSMRIAVSSSVREFGRENFLQVEFRLIELLDLSTSFRLRNEMNWSICIGNMRMH